MSSRFTRSTMTALVAAVAGCSTAQSAQSNEDAQAISVRVAPALDSARPAVAIASGVVQAQTVVDVSFQVAGKVVAVVPEEGSAVRSGELLAQIDSTDYRLGVEQAEAQAEHATSERERYRPLVATGSLSASDFEKIESGARQATAAADLARKRLADTRLIAPMSGIVAKRTIERGATASTGQPVFTLVNVDPVRVRIGVSESEVGSLRLGQMAEVRLPSLPDATFSGRVTLIGIVADPTTRTYAVEVSVPNADHRLKVGMVAEARVRMDRESRAISVPTSAVTRDADGVSRLYVVDTTARRAHARRVELGATRDNAIEVTQGLSAGELVVVAGQHRVHDGSRVIVATDAVMSGRRTGGAQ